MKKIIYICEDCRSCDKVIDFVTAHNIQVQVISIGEEVESPQPISIFPAYYEGDKLMAYGEDIIRRLESAA